MRHGVFESPRTLHLSRGVEGTGTSTGRRGRCRNRQRGRRSSAAHRWTSRPECPADAVVCATGATGADERRGRWSGEEMAGARRVARAALMVRGAGNASITLGLYSHLPLRPLFRCSDRNSPSYWATPPESYDEDNLHSIVSLCAAEGVLCAILLSTALLLVRRSKFGPASYTGDEERPT